MQRNPSSKEVSSPARYPCPPSSLASSNDYFTTLTLSIHYITHNSAFKRNFCLFLENMKRFTFMELCDCQMLCQRFGPLLIVWQVDRDFCVTLPKNSWSFLGSLANDSASLVVHGLSCIESSVCCSAILFLKELTERWQFSTHSEHSQYLYLGTLSGGSKASGLSSSLLFLKCRGKG